MASRGKAASLRQMYVADLETCDAWVKKGEQWPDQRVWLAGRMNLQTMKPEYFNSLDGFMAAILARGENVNTEYAFHNLKFDGSFVVPWLLFNGYTATEGVPKEPRTFSTLIDERNQWYSIVIRVTRKRKVTLWDSLKLFPCALEYLHQEYGTPAHKVEVTQEFYERIRPEGHVPTAEELRYMESDLLVLAETLREHIRIYGPRFKKTQAGQAFANFEAFFPAWKLRFPPLEDDIDEQIRPAYWGGLAYVNPKHQGKDCYNIGSYDINSSYPAQLSKKPLPYGPLLKRTGEGQEPDHTKFWVGELLATFSLKPGHVPCIPTRAIIEGRPVTVDKWLADSEGVVRLVISSVDYVTILEQYHFSVIRWNWALHWAQRRHREVAAFVETNNEIKVNNRAKAKQTDDPEVKRELLIRANRAKIDNNAFYGKFGEDIVKHRKTPALERGEVIYRNAEPDIVPLNRRRFLPVAIAVTAWARRQLIQFANILGDDFIYCDTDSVHYFRQGGEPKIQQAIERGDIITDALELGAWEHEGNYTRGRFLRAKCYMEDDSVTCAGLPADKGTGRGSKTRSCCTWENFRIGLVIPGGNGKLRTVRTRTGNKLVPTDFEIKENPTLFNSF